MFFRHEKPSVPTFSDRLDRLKASGFTVAPEGSAKARVGKGRCAAVIAHSGDEPRVDQAGMVVSGEIGLLVHGGFQMFWQTAAGKREAALAPQLKAFHDFEEDLKEGLGLTSLYNESLGTTCERHMYDRIANRDAGVPRRPWQK